MIMYSTTPSEIEKIINETFKIQNINDSFMYDNTKYYREAAEAYISLTHIYLANVFIAPFTQGIWIEKAKKNFDLMKFALEYFENCKDKRLRGIIQSLFGISNLHFGFHYSADKQEQNEYMNRGLRYAEQGEKILREVNDKPNLLYNLVWTLHHLLLYRQFEYVQKRIVKVVNEVLDLLKVFEDVQSFYNFMGYILPANYYVNNAQRSFFKPKQRISFAHKGIEYTEKGERKHQNFEG